jgi:hypothetical protein
VGIVNTELLVGLESGLVVYRGFVGFIVEFRREERK